MRIICNIIVSYKFLPFVWGNSLREVSFPLPLLSLEVCAVSSRRKGRMILSAVIFRWNPNSALSETKDAGGTGGRARRLKRCLKVIPSWRSIKLSVKPRHLHCSQYEFTLTRSYRREQVARRGSHFLRANRARASHFRVWPVNSYPLVKLRPFYIVPLVVVTVVGASRRHRAVNESSVRVSRARHLLSREKNLRWNFQRKNNSQDGHYQAFATKKPRETRDMSPR